MWERFKSAIITGGVMACLVFFGLGYVVGNSGHDSCRSIPMTGVQMEGRGDSRGGDFRGGGFRQGNGGKDLPDKEDGSDSQDKEDSSGDTTQDKQAPSAAPDQNTQAPSATPDQGSQTPSGNSSGNNSIVYHFTTPSDADSL